MVRDEEDSSSDEHIDYRNQYRILKKKLVNLITENVAFENILRQSQRKLLKTTRDKEFLLDRLLEYEKPVVSISSTGETTDSSDDEPRQHDTKRKKSHSSSHSNSSKPSSKKKKLNDKSDKSSSTTNAAGSSTSHKSKPSFDDAASESTLPSSGASTPRLSIDGHMTPEEVERHLESSRSRHTSTVRPGMFNTEPSLDSESSEVYDEVNTSSFLDENVGDMISETRSM